MANSKFNFSSNNNGKIWINTINTDTIGGAYSLLDLTALGRQEDWEEPKGRAPRVHGADPTFTD